MHVIHLDDRIIAGHGVLGFAVPHQEWRNLARATGAPGRRSEQRRRPTDSYIWSRA